MNNLGQLSLHRYVFDKWLKISEMVGWMGGPHVTCRL